MAIWMRGVSGVLFDEYRRPATTGRLHHPRLQIAQRRITQSRTEAEAAAMAHPERFGASCGSTR